MATIQKETIDNNSKLLCKSKHISGRSEQVIRGIETPEFIKVGKHLFIRYLYDDPYAEEMKCRCGAIIWPVFSEREALEALDKLNIDPNKCL